MITRYLIGHPPTSEHDQGDRYWWDLCAGPHLNFTGEIHPKAFALESVAGTYLLQKEEAKRRDHRKIGQALDLFSIQEDAGGGLVFWHPKGARIRLTIDSLQKVDRLILNPARGE